MRRTSLALLAVPAVALGAFALTGQEEARSAPSRPPPAPMPQGEKSPARPMPEFVDRFRTHDTKRWQVSDGWRNGDYMVNDWRATQARFGRGLTLILERRKTDKADFTSGEVQSTATYGSGYYETAMRAAPGSGVVSALFTYTGPHFGDPWDEIDIEFLGSKPREVMFTYFTDGKKESKVVALPFDATKETHRYGFDWQPGYIRWYIDGELKHEVTGATLALPTRRQKIMTEVWASSTLTDWVGPFDAKALPTGAVYECVSYAVKRGGQGC